MLHANSIPELILASRPIMFRLLPLSAIAWRSNSVKVGLSCAFDIFPPWLKPASCRVANRHQYTLPSRKKATPAPQ